MLAPRDVGLCSSVLLLPCAGGGKARTHAAALQPFPAGHRLEPRLQSCSPACYSSIAPRDTGDRPGPVPCGTWCPPAQPGTHSSSEHLGRRQGKKALTGLAEGTGSCRPAALPQNPSGGQDRARLFLRGSWLCWSSSWIRSAQTLWWLAGAGQPTRFHPNPTVPVLSNGRAIPRAGSIDPTDTGASSQLLPWPPACGHLGQSLSSDPHTVPWVPSRPPAMGPGTSLPEVPLARALPTPAPQAESSREDARTARFQGQCPGSTLRPESSQIRTLGAPHWGTARSSRSPPFQPGCCILSQCPGCAPGTGAQKPSGRETLAPSIPALPARLPWPPCRSGLLRPAKPHPAAHTPGWAPEQEKTCPDQQLLPQPELLQPAGLCLQVLPHRCSTGS